MIKHIKHHSKNIFKPRYAWFAGFLILVFLCFKTFDSTVNFFTSPAEIAETDSLEIDSIPQEYVEAFKSLDQKVEKVILERNLTATTQEVHEMVKKVKIADPLVSIPISTTTSGQNYSPTWVYENDSNKSNTYRKKKIYTFYIVTHNGYVTNQYGAVQYYLPGEDKRYYYEITLKEGVYTFITLGLTPNDTVPFAIDQTGVYKLGFQETHPNFLIFKDSLP